MKSQGKRLHFHHVNYSIFQFVYDIQKFFYFTVDKNLSMCIYNSVFKKLLKHLYKVNVYIKMKKFGGYHG